MRRFLPLLAILAAVPASARIDTARMLGGHATGPAIHCLNPRDIQGQTLVNESVIVFETRGRKYYRNDIVPSCPAIKPDRAIVTRSFGSSNICEGDIFDVFDPVSRIGFGGCSFGAFTPYELPPAK